MNLNGAPSVAMLPGGLSFMDYVKLQLECLGFSGIDYISKLSEKIRVVLNLGNKTDIWEIFASKL